MMQDSRNRKLNSAYRPKWMAPDTMQTVIPGTTGDTNFDPFAGSGWGRWLDMVGAGNAGGVGMAGGRMMPNSPNPQSIESMRLQNALAGMGDQPGAYVGDPNKPGRRQMDQNLARKYPGAQ